MTCERWFWVRADGTGTRELTQWVDGTEVQKVFHGRYSPKTVVTRQVVPGRPGALTTNRRHDWRPFTLPLAAKGATLGQLQLILKTLAQDMDPLDGFGILRYVGTDGHVSDLYAVQTAEFDPEAFKGSTGITGQFMTLVFEADEPYFLRDTVTDYVQGSDPSYWFGMGGSNNWISNPWVGGSSVLGELTINSNSDATVWPKWTVVGPGASPVFTNNVTGETFSLPGVVLAAHETLVIDLSPGVKTITGPDGSNWFSFLDDTDLELWPFYKGNNPVTLTLSDATSASYIGWSYRPRTFAP